MVVQLEQQSPGEFELASKEVQEVAGAVEELREDGWHLAGLSRANEAAALPELVTEPQPILLHQGLGESECKRWTNQSARTWKTW